MFGLLTFFTRLYWSKGSPARQLSHNADPVIITCEWKHLLVAFFFPGSSKAFPHAKQFGVEMHMNRTEPPKFLCSFVVKDPNCSLRIPQCTLDEKKKPCHNYPGQVRSLGRIILIHDYPDGRHLSKINFSRVLCRDKIFHGPFSIFANTYKHLRFIN